MSPVGLFPVLLMSLVVGFSASDDSCMARWMVLSGINYDTAAKFEERLKIVGADEKTYDNFDSLLYENLFNKLSRDFLRCMRKQTKLCQTHAACKNGGVCRYNANGSTYSCHCKSGFQGKFCETVTTVCDSGPCQNGGRCEPHLVGSYKCHCPVGFEGRHCETRWMLPDVFKAIPGELANLTATTTTSIIALQKMISPLSSKLEQLSANVTDISQTNAKLSTKIEQLSANVTDISKNTSNLSASLGQLSANVTDISQRLTNHEMNKGLTRYSPADSCTSAVHNGLTWITWNNTIVQVYCRSSESHGGDGSTPSAAGMSCDSINTYFPARYNNTPNATVWINPSMSVCPTGVFKIYCDFSIKCGPGEAGGWSLVYSSRDDQSGHNNMQKGTRYNAVITTLHPGNANKKLAYDVLSALNSSAKPFTQVMLTGYHDYSSPGTLIKMCFNNTARNTSSGQQTFMSFIDWGIGKYTDFQQCTWETFHGTELQTGYPILLTWDDYAFCAGYGNGGCSWTKEVWNEIDNDGGHLLTPSQWPTRAEFHRSQSTHAGACHQRGLFHIFVR